VRFDPGEFDELQDDPGRDQDPILKILPRMRGDFHGLGQGRDAILTELIPTDLANSGRQLISIS